MKNRMYKKYTEVCKEWGRVEYVRNTDSISDFGSDFSLGKLNFKQVSFIISFPENAQNVWEWEDLWIRAKHERDV